MLPEMVEASALEFHMGAAEDLKQLHVQQPEMDGGLAALHKTICCLEDNRPSKAAEYGRHDMLTLEQSCVVSAARKNNQRVCYQDGSPGGL